MIATGGYGGHRTEDNNESSIQIWDAKTGELVATLKGHIYMVSCLAWTPDGKMLISGSSPTPTISGRRVVVCKKRPGTCKRMPLRSVVLAARCFGCYVVMPFAVKLPCRSPRALAEHFCPPELVPHDHFDYPVYYDALYYPQYHTSHFETPQTFCSWLLQCLQTHHVSCPSCSSPFVGCVTFNGMSVVISRNNASTFLSLREIECPGYRHCMILGPLAMRHSSSVASSIASRLEQCPPWLYYADSTIEHNLAALSVPVLKQCAVALPGTKVQRGSKAVLVRAILQSFQTARSEFTGLSCACATSRLHDVQLPSSYVAEVLRRPPPAAYAVHPCPVSPIPWTSLSTEELVRRLLKLSVDTLTNSIHLLPLFGRPAINSRSRAKMCNGLVCHVRERALYLQAVGSHVLSAIWLSYFPFEHPFAHPDSHYILTVLEVEYGPDVVRSLSQEVQSPANRLKMMRREQRNIHLREEVQLSLQRQQQWPVLVPNETVLASLNRYYEASRWSATSSMRSLCTTTAGVTTP
ncbi:hypothetical protein DEU56DRAFT_983831 [Suillus clintonianus]|uniref:uncharacterized protein n=1 Tax=Suillus clintonianus TaxID=1904413 RepID=UPI001B85EA4C|nr:uncharacterized protein DEU56DRAFT_983831 [Suillus clintonianus]KAG2123405.1 hypothetical protein DEU56DRAFT_983831 [Suillus clintonianus]